MARRHAWRTGCASSALLDLPVAGGVAEVLLMQPAKKRDAWALMVHGYACNRLIPFVLISRLLLERGYAVASVPLPGHHPKAPPLDANAMTDYLPTVIRGLEEALGRQPEIVVGNSLGSVLLLLALPLLKQLQAGILIQPPLHLDRPYSASLQDLRTSFDHRLRWAMRRYPWSSAFEFVFKRHRVLGRDGQIRRLSVLHPATMPQLDQLFQSIGFQERLAQIQGQDLLFMTGERDPIAPPEDVRAIAGLVTGKCDIQVIEGVNHTTIFFVPDTLEAIARYLDRR